MSVTLEKKPIQVAPPTAALVIGPDVEWVDRDLPTASWWDRYELEPGTYPLEWVDLNYRPWNPDPAAHTPGYIGNIGPYFAQVRIPALLVESYRVSRLFQHSMAHHTEPNEPEILTRSIYAYMVPGCPKGQHGEPLDEWLGGRVVPLS